MRAVLLHVSRPARLSYTVLSGNPFTVRFFGASCMRITFRAVDGSVGRRRWRLTSAAGSAGGTLDGVQPIMARRSLAGGAHEDFVLHVPGGAVVTDVGKTHC
jgi:hypothetical protein